MTNNDSANTDDTDSTDTVTVSLTRKQAEAVQHLLYNVQSNPSSAYQGLDTPKNPQEQLRHLGAARGRLAEVLMRHDVETAG